MILRADITTLERQREFVRKLQKLRTDIRTLAVEKTHLQSEVEVDVEAQSSNQTSLFSKIRLYFNEIVEDVIDSKALLSVSVNQQGHLEFRVELLDDAGNATSADRGHSYKKLMCIAFDLAVLRAHLDDAFPRFAFHDGIFETLDDRKKENLLDVTAVDEESIPGGAILVWPVFTLEDQTGRVHVRLRFESTTSSYRFTACLFSSGA